MTPKDQDFYGKEVADAIREACETLRVPQEQLEIEVVETGSTGIFGLIRKKAHIKAHVKPVSEQQEEGEGAKADSSEQEGGAKKTAPKPRAEKKEKEPVAPEPPQEEPLKETPAKKLQEEEEKKKASADLPVEEADYDNGDEDDEEPDNGNGAMAEELPPESLSLIEKELSSILELMGYPSTVEASAKGASVQCHVSEEHEDILTGQEGKTLDSIQYLLRKIVARKVPNRLRLTVDVGNYREKRLASLKDRAAELAEQVKEDGKTQVIAALSPSERRVIHMSLQDDKEIRSRSVGDGLFKKILIYKPGKGGRAGGRKRNNFKGRRGNNNRKKSE